MSQFKFFLLLIVFLMALAACSPSRAPEGASDGLEELLQGAAGGEIDAEITVQPLASLKTQTLTTQALPTADTPLLLEATGKTPGGKELKMVFYGVSADSAILGFQGKMRIQARAARVQGKRVLRGTAVQVQTAQSASVLTLPFLATGPNTTFSGPQPGTAFELRGSGESALVCGSSTLAGAFNQSSQGQSNKGVLIGLFEGQAPCAPGTKLAPTLQSVLNLTAVQTRMGVLLGGPGSVGGNSFVLPVFALTVGEQLPQSIGFVDVEAADGVRVMDAAAAAQLLSFDLKTGTMVFKELAGSLAGLRVGDVVVATPRPKAPNGFLRRVREIGGANGAITVTTTRANLKDALKRSNLRIERRYTAADVRQGAALAQGQTLYAAAPQVSAQALFDDIVVNINKVIFDQDGNNSTTNDQLKVNGKLTLEPKIVIDLDCTGFLCSKPDFLAKFEMTETTELTVTGNLVWEEDKTFQLARIVLPPITAAFLVFTPEIVVEVNMSGEVSVGMEFRAEQTISFEAGVEYKSGSGWDTIDSFSKSFSADPPSFEADLEAEASLGVEGRLMLYGVAGVSAGIELYAHLEAGIPRDPAWELTGGLRGDIGVDLDIIIWQEEFSIPLFDTSWTIAIAPNTAPVVTRLIPVRTCSDGTVPRGVPSNLVTLDANTDDAEDGKGQGTVSWSSNVNGFLGTTSPGSKHQPGYSLSNGQHTITATVTDSKGKTGSKTLQIEVVSACLLGDVPPTVSITNSPPLLIVEGQPFTLTATTQAGLSLSCCQVTWRSDVAGLLGTSNGGPCASGQNQKCHSFAHTFNPAVPQTITATVTHNGATATDSLELGALTQTRSNPNLGQITQTNPSGSAYAYEDDSVNFSATVTNATLRWTSSNSADTFTSPGSSSTGVSFATPGVRTLTVTAKTPDGGFGSKSLKVNVLPALAKP